MGKPKTRKRKRLTGPEINPEVLNKTKRDDLGKRWGSAH